MICVGIDWAEAHNDVVVMNPDGRVLARRRCPAGVRGIGELHELVGEHASEPGQVVVGIEVDHGLLVDALMGAGYALYAVNPLAASRYRERHTTSGAKSDAGDAKVLADLVRTDRQNHRRLVGSSEHLRAIRHLARAHQGLIWTRRDLVNALRADLREYFPGALEAFGEDIAGADALAVLGIAPTPERARALSMGRIRGALERGGRRRNLDSRARGIRGALASPQLAAPGVVSEALGAITARRVTLLVVLAAQIAGLEAELAECADAHPDTEILRGLPGLGAVLGARVLGEFGDDPNRFADARGRKAYAGTAPITRASGRRVLVGARHARNRRLADACQCWAFCSLRASPGARGYYDTLRARGKSHRMAIRQLANRWVGIAHHCLVSGVDYDERLAWPARQMSEVPA